MGMKKADEYQYVLWDFNGTLIDDLDVGLEIQNIMLAERHLPPLDKTRYLESFDFPIREWYRYLGYDVGQYEQLANVWGSLYDQMVAGCPLHQGALSLLKRLNQAGKRQSVLSASYQKQLDMLIQLHGLNRYFEHIYGLDNNLAGGKQALGAQVKAQLDCSAQAILLIGDTTQDFLTAQCIGCDCALVAVGHQDQGRLSAVCDSVFESFAALEQALF